MSQRSTSPLKRSTVRRTLQRFWDVTRTQPLIVFLSVFSSAGYIILLTFSNTYVMALIVDRVQAGALAPSGDGAHDVASDELHGLVERGVVLADDLARAAGAVHDAADDRGADDDRAGEDRDPSCL